MFKIIYFFLFPLHSFWVITLLLCFVLHPLKHKKSGFLSTYTPPTARTLRVGKRWAGDIVNTASLNPQRIFPTIWPHAHHAEKEERTGGTCTMMAFVSQATSMHIEALLPKKWLNIIFYWEIENNIFSLLYFPWLLLFFSPV